MSHSPSRAWLRCVAGILASVPALVALGGCHHRSSAVKEPSPAEPVGVAYGQQASDEPILPRFPGVDVIRTPSGGVAIRVLGAMVGDGDPLYVIDGTPAVVDRRFGISWLAPEAIARIRVLRHPAETAVYGPRGVKGVVLITTKLGATVQRRNR